MEAMLAQWRVEQITLALKKQEQETEKQVTCLARNVYYEARGEPKQGQIAVAQVTINRVKSKFAATICDVVYQRGQFEWTQLKKPKFDRGSWKRAREIAERAIRGELQDLTKGALYFHRADFDPGEWLTYEVQRIQIGHHVFFRKRHSNPVAKASN